MWGILWYATNIGAEVSLHWLSQSHKRIFRSITACYVPVYWQLTCCSSPTENNTKKQISIRASTISFALSISPTVRSAGPSAFVSKRNTSGAEQTVLQLKTFPGGKRGKNPKRERYRSVEARPARGITVEWHKKQGRDVKVFLEMERGEEGRGGKDWQGQF